MVLGAIASSSASARTVGNFSPGPRPPTSIMCRTRAASWTYMGIPLRGFMSIQAAISGPFLCYCLIYMKQYYIDRLRWSRAALNGLVRGVLRDPDAYRGVFGEGGQYNVLDVEAPEFAGYGGGVGHGAARFDAGKEGGGAGLFGDPGERALGEGAGEGAGRDALAGADAGQFGEDVGAVYVVLIDRGA